MKQFGRIRAWAINHWQTAGSLLLLIAIPTLVFTFQLTALTDNLLLSREASALGSAFSKRAIFEDPLYIIFKLPEYLLRLLHINSLFTVRLVPAALATVTIMAIYYVARQWYGNKTALATFVMCCCSSWLLAYGRLATPDIVYPMLISLGLAYGAWLRKTKRSGLAMVGGVLLGLAYIYTPGLIWIAIIAVVWQRRIILQRIADAPRLTTVILVMVAVGVSPLILSVVLHPELINQVAGFSSSPSHSLSNVGISAVDILQQFVVQGHNDAELGITKVALLDIFTYVMAILGAVVIFNSRRLDRFKIIGALLAILWLLAALGGPVPIIAMFPVIYLLLASGIGRLLSDWLTVFPRNPLARSLGMSVIGIAIALSCLYHIERYFVAWPSAPPTGQIQQIARTNAPYYKNLLQ